MSVDERQPRRRAAALLVALASIWMATVGNAPLWRELQSLGLLQARGGALLLVTLAGMLVALLFALLSLFSWPRVLKPAIAVLLVATALGAHFIWSYHIVIDSAMATNALQTDWHEALALLTARLVLVVVLGALLPAWLLWRMPVAWRPWKQQAVRNLAGLALSLVASAALLLASFQPLASTMRNHKELRFLANPLNTVYAAGYAAFGGKHMTGPIMAVGTDAHVVASGGKPRLLVLVPQDHALRKLAALACTSSGVVSRG